MPIYEFVCEACGGMIERLQKLSDPPPTVCEECGGKMAKIMSRNSFQLKGGGWYKDLYSSASVKAHAPGAETSKSVPPSSTPASAQSSAQSGTSTSAKPSAPAPASKAAPTVKSGG